MCISGVAIPEKLTQTAVDLSTNSSLCYVFAGGSGPESVPLA